MEGAAWTASLLNVQDAPRAQTVASGTWLRRALSLRRPHSLSAALLPTAAKVCTRSRAMHHLARDSCCGPSVDD